jgi:hypothetical protein
VDGHLLDQGQGRDDGGGQVAAAGAEVVDDLPVEALAAVDQGEEGEQGRWVLQLGHEGGELLQAADREGRGDEGYRLSALDLSRDRQTRSEIYDAHRRTNNVDPDGSA